MQLNESQFTYQQDMVPLGFHIPGRDAVTWTATPTYLGTIPPRFLSAGRRVDSFGDAPCDVVLDVGNIGGRKKGRGES